MVLELGLEKKHKRGFGPEIYRISSTTVHCKHPLCNALEGNSICTLFTVQAIKKCLRENFSLRLQAGNFSL